MLRNWASGDLFGADAGCGDGVGGFRIGAEGVFDFIDVGRIRAEDGSPIGWVSHRALEVGPLAQRRREFKALGCIPFGGSVTIRVMAGRRDARDDGFAPLSK